MISLLIEAGADADRANKNGVSPRRLAETIGNYQLVDFLVRK